MIINTRALLNLLTSFYFFILSSKAFPSPHPGDRTTITSPGLPSQNTAQFGNSWNDNVGGKADPTSSVRSSLNSLSYYSTSGTSTTASEAKSSLGSLLPPTVPLLTISTSSIGLENDVLPSFTAINTAVAISPPDPAVARRGDILRDTNNASTQHRKRVLPSPETYGGNVDRFLVGEMQGKHELSHGFVGTPRTTGFTYSLGKRPNKWYLRNMFGCTAIIVVSTKRMFMTHIFEDPSIMNAEDLETDVIDALNDGVQGEFPPLHLYTGVGGDFANTPENHVRAFIYTPYLDNVPNPAYDQLEFRDQVARIKEELNRILGRNDATHLPYRARERIGAPPNTDGKILVQYDAIHFWEGHYGDPICYRQYARLEIWNENQHHLYQHTWQAFPIIQEWAPQAPHRPPPPIQRRQGNGACALRNASPSRPTPSQILPTVHGKTKFQTLTKPSPVAASTVKGQKSVPGKQKHTKA